MFHRLFLAFTTTLLLLALTAPAFASPPRRAEDRLALSAGAGLGKTWAAGSAVSSSALFASATYRIAPQLGVVVDAWLLDSTFKEECPQDTACYVDNLTGQSILTAGPRLHLTPRLHAQVTFGASRVTSEKMVSWKVTQAASVAWLYPIGATRLGAELRGSYATKHSTPVENIHTMVTVARTW